MTSTISLSTEANVRDHSFTICKAIAIICVVLSHAGGPGWLGAFVFQFHVPIFFLCAGYFFHTHYLTDEKTFVKRRFCRLYLPFLRWSIFFLFIHNLLFPLGILSETYGNASGGVTHPYSWHAFCQRLWSITFNMSGYDEFLCGAFWFFRALFLSSLVFFLLFKIIRHFYPKVTNTRIALSILCICVLLAVWQTTCGLKITGVGQGGYRELCGISFMAIGFLYKENRACLKLDWRCALPALLLLVVGAAFVRSSMGYSHTLVQFLPVLPFGVFGFMFIYWLSMQINRRENFLRDTLIYIGERTLYIFAFHLLAFKVVSAVKVAWYHLPWEQVGGHTVVNYKATEDFFFLAYLVVGVALPLLWLAAYRALEKRFQFTLAYEVIFSKQHLLRFCMLLLVGIRHFFKFTYRVLRALVRFIWSGIKSFGQGIKNIISASSPKDE